MTHTAARVTSLLLGVWLFISAFMWGHTSEQFNNALVVGALSALVAAGAMSIPNMRYLNAAFAVWLLLSSWLLPWAHTATLWNGVIVSLAMFVASLIGESTPSGPARSRPA